MIKNGRHRYDGSPSLPYYSSSELGIQEETFSFYSGKNRLYGSRYYAKEGGFKGVIVFFHGIGAGRNAYLKLISVFAKAGYLVYAYDNTGCMESEGRGYLGLGQTNYDQKAFFTFLNSDPKAKGYHRYAVGHSWGGYSALLSLRKEFHIEKVVSIAGFLNPNNEILFTMKKHGIRAPIFLIRLCSRLLIGKDANLDAIDLLNNTDAKVLYIQGDADHLVPFKTNGYLLQSRFKNNPNIRFLFLKKRGHSPYLKEEAERYCLSFMVNVTKTIVEENHPKMDIEKACLLDTKVIQAIIDFLGE